LKLSPKSQVAKGLPDFKSLTLEKLKHVCKELKLMEHQTNKGELASFIAYAIAFPSSCLCLLDTYSVL